MPSSIEAKLQGTGEIIEVREWENKTRNRIRGVEKSTGRQVLYAFHNFPSLTKRQVDVVDKQNRKNNIAKQTTFRQKRVEDSVLEMPSINESIGSCIYKLYYGDRFIIHRATNTLKGSIYNLLRAYSYFKGYANVHKETSDKKDYYYVFYNFMRRNKDKQLRVEVLFQSSDLYELLAFEHNELQKTLSVKKCLNPNITSYIPTRTNLISQEIIERYKKDFQVA